MSSSLDDLINSNRIVVMLGAGGVGKTTSSIVLALAAARRGRRVALLSIDPARRLAAALGIPLGNQLRRVQTPDGFKGTLDAAMLDQKAVFDGMVRRHAPSDVVAEKILAHPVYRAASTNLSGPLEYMALAKLQELAEDHRYDFIVLDTPPDTHALDFLARPNVLAGYMENKVMSWLIKPFLLASRFGLGRMLSAGEKLMGGVAKVLGVSALHAFADFLMLMQEVIEGFHRSGERILALLARHDTRFMLVTVPTLAAARSAANIESQLTAMNYRVSLLLFNRCLPSEVVAQVAAADDQSEPWLQALAARARGEAAVKAALPKAFSTYPAPSVVNVADQDDDIGTVAAVIKLVDAFEAAAVSDQT